MPTCIYCRRSAEAQFPREHVVPRAFGRFRDNLTLRCVCGACNEFFDRELELFLTRDTVEALLRVHYGLKVKAGRRKLGQSRLTIRVISPGDWYGARLLAERNEAGTEISAEPLPQVGFRKNGEADRHWFREHELDKTQDWARYRTEAETNIVGKPDAVVQRLFDKLQNLGVVFKRRYDPETHRGLVPVFAHSVLDDIIFRGVAKIGFNFLAHVEGADFVLRPDFDEIRDYIRFGVKPRQPLVGVTRNPILHGDGGSHRQTYGHIVVVDWDRLNEGIVCLLSPFNHLTYHILLCRNYSGVWHPLYAGRHFDWRTLAISPVYGI